MIIQLQWINIIIIIILVGTWVLDEVRKTMEMGYGLGGRVWILGIFFNVLSQRYHFSRRFCRLVNMFLKLKQESSDYPSWVQSDEDKEKYIEDYRRAEGIASDKASISKNAGQRLRKTWN